MACLLEKFRFLQNREVCDVSRLRFQRMIGTALSPEGHRFPSRTKRLIELRNDVLRAQAPACKLKVHHGGAENTARPRRNQPPAFPLGSRGRGRRLVRLSGHGPLLSGAVRVETPLIQPKLPQGSRGLRLAAKPAAFSG